jgi:hypothetical protein
MCITLCTRILHDMLQACQNIFRLKNKKIPDEQLLIQKEFKKPHPGIYIICTHILQTDRHVQAHNVSYCHSHNN